VIELILFLGVMCTLFFVPVDFRFFYRKVAEEDVLILEMIFLKGMIKRGRITSLLHPTNLDGSKNEKEFGRWFFIKQAPQPPKPPKPPKQSKQFKKASEKVDAPLMKELNFLERLKRFGLGVTLLGYFLPGNYSKWVRITEKLEKRGAFTKFHWSSRLGSGEPALTTVLVGVLSGIKAIMVAMLSHTGRFRVAPKLKVYPEFGKPSLDTVIDCIFSVKLGYIILAGLLAKLRQQ